MAYSLEKYIASLEEELKSLRAPYSYCEHSYYESCRIKADYLEYDILPGLKNLLKETKC
jgi:hypothetical protein